MTGRDVSNSALAAVQQLRRSRGFSALPEAERGALERDLGRLERALRGESVGNPEALAADPYAVGLANPFAPQPQQPQQPAAPPPAPAPPGTAQIGRRAGDALEAINFPGFVASLLQGTFQAIVDATTQQVREYASLVASLSQSLDDFTRDNVSAAQTRGELAQRYPQDLTLAVPEPGKPGETRLVPRPDRAGQSPRWLADFGLAGQELSEELTEGKLLSAGRMQVGEQRMQMLATTVLMGINRIVVNDGDIRARLQFHAAAKESTSADLLTASAGSGGIAGRSIGGGGAGSSMMVSTLKANAQAEASIKADLMGSVRISFRTETFPLERFADSAAIQLLQRHARWGGGGEAAAPAGAKAGGKVEDKEDDK